MKLLLLDSAPRRYLREIASLTRQPVRAVQRELARLATAGMITSTAEGNRKYYQVNRQSPIFAELKGMFVKTAGLGSVLRGSLGERGVSIRVAFIFGSFPRGTETVSSDIDLMIVGTLSNRDLAKMLAPAREALGREVNTTLMTPGEFRRKLQARNAFLIRVLTEPKIFLIGGEDDIEDLAGRRAAEIP